MGWTQTSKTHNTIKEFFEQQVNYENEEFKQTILDAAQVGFTEAYAAVERIIKSSGERTVFALAYMIQYTKGYYDFGYKDMSEHMGPGICRCPERILKLLTPLPEPSGKDDSTEWARQWRENCWARINEAKERRKQRRKNGPRFKEGDTVIFRRPLRFSDGSSRDKLKVLSTKPLRFTDGTASFFGPNSFKLRRDTLDYYLKEIVPAGTEVKLEPQVPDLEQNGYPKYVDEHGHEQTCIGWAVGQNGWEWYAFDIVDKDNHIYFGFVHGFEDEYGNFSSMELQENGIEFITNPDKLNEIAPPVGWTKVA